MLCKIWVEITMVKKRFRRTLKDVQVLRSEPSKKYVPKGGSLSKLNLEMTDLICDALSRGHYPQFAAANAGISYETLKNWLKKGKSDFERLSRLDERGVPLRDEDYSLFFDLYMKVQKALFNVQDSPLQNIIAASEEDWRAAAHFLERRFPKEWGKKEGKTAIEVNANTTTQTVIVVPEKAKSVDEWNEMVEERRRIAEQKLQEENALEVAAEEVEKQDS